jgi:hypothetical protein
MSHAGSLLPPGDRRRAPRGEARLREVSLLKRVHFRAVMITILVLLVIAALIALAHTSVMVPGAIAGTRG